MKRPNILLMYTDQQRRDALGAAGNPHIRTPNLDKLAADGLNFTNCVVQNPVCMPSRAAMLTGLYCSELRIFTNGVPLPEKYMTLPKLLKPYGYVSGNFGKIHFLPHANRDHREPHPLYGFDELEISDEPGCYPDAYYHWVLRQAPEYADKVSSGLPPAAETWRAAMRPFDDPMTGHPTERFPKRPIPARVPDEFTHTAFVADRTIDFIRRSAGRPFFAIAGFYFPHSPWIAPQRFIDLYDPKTLPVPDFPPELQEKRSEQFFSDGELRSAVHGYYATVSEVDYQAGRILETLDELGIADDTIVVFTADHGERLGEHLTYGKGQPGFDSDTRVPLLLRWPVEIRNPGTAVSDIIESIDILPTLLRGAGIPVPPFIQGRAVDLSREEVSTGRDSALIEMDTCKSLRSSRYRYTLFRDGRETLFDYENPYAEYRDISGDSSSAGVLSEMRRELAFRQMEMERPRKRAWAY